MLVEILVVRGNIEIDFTVGGGDFTVLDGRRDVGTFSTPRDVVCVTESVDVKDIDVGWGEKEVLDKLYCKHR